MTYVEFGDPRVTNLKFSDRTGRGMIRVYGHQSVAEHREVLEVPDDDDANRRIGVNPQFANY